jgi:hypothetical protein
VKINDQKNSDLEPGQEASLYPYTSLAPTLKIADAVKELGGARSPVSKSRLASHLKQVEKSASFLQRISSAKVFGLIVGRGDYSLSEAAKRYYSPTNEYDRANALLEFLAAPSSFREIIRLFDGDRLPSREILANIFSEKLKVPESWKERAASFFENSAQHVGVIDEHRIIRFKATQNSNERLTPPAQTESDKKLADATAKGQVPKVFSLNEKKSFYLDKERDREVTLDCPFSITRSEYNRICKWIDATWIIEDGMKEGPQ